MFLLYLLVVTALTLGPQAGKGQIVGGEDAKPGEFPYHALLKEDGKYFCSGCLISHRHVLTAGHCVKGLNIEEERLTALLGTIHIERGGVSHTIVAGKYHEEYVGSQPRCTSDWMYDIGMFKLKSDVTLSDFVTFGKLPDNGEYETNANAVFSAAGDTFFGGSTSETLQKLTVRVIDHNTCQSMLRRRGNYRVDNTYICTWVVSGSGTCNGDSGGPLVQNNVIIGIAAGGINPPARGIPDIFTNVFQYRDWIDKTKEQI